MSRIHEALKKAASERNAQLPGDSASELVELAGKSVAEREIPAKVRGAGNGSAGSGKALSPQLEELLRKCRRTEWKIDPRFSVFVNETRDRSGAEKFRTLRSRLYQIAATRSLKRIVVTSSVPEEGKTFIASNLAQSIIRQEHRRVLLIDGDLRASRLHFTLGASATPGLSDYLRGEADEFKIVQTGKPPNLSLIASGTEVPNPSELLHSNAMRTLLDRLTPLFDWVILDSPPAMAVHDASILADMCDGVLFVVRAGATDFEVAQKAAGEFDEKRLLGVVLNRVEKGEGYPYYYAYSKEQEES
jgi:capsular exopolysaccharide synthesis family protein